MKKIIAVVFLVCFAASAFADDPPPAAKLTISPDVGKAQCANQPGKGLAIVWGKVNDKRETPAVGTFKKGKEEFDVQLAGSVDSQIGDAVRTVLKNCGYTIEDKGGPATVHVNVDVNQFFAGSVKKWFTGETDAKSSFSLHLKSEISTYDWDFGATKSDKRLRKKSIQQLEMVLSGLLDETVVQIAESPTLHKEIKQLSGK